MEYNNEALKQLSEQVARLHKIKAMLDSLYSQRQELECRVSELASQSQAEQADVDRLERATLTAFFYRMTGQIEEQMDKERREAYVARLKYQDALRELEAAERQCAGLEREQESLFGCELAYQRALEEKRAWLRQSDPSRAAELLEREGELARLNDQERELQEARAAGSQALAITDRILASLSDAEGWGTWDLLGGGMISAMAKHSALDEAQDRVEELQIALRRFKTELADVQVESDLQIQIDGFLRFADYFFDGFLADWAVLDRINRSQSQVRDVRDRIDKVLDRLDWNLERLLEQKERLQRELETWVANA